jgi:hypothetical protein
VAGIEHDPRSRFRTVQSGRRQEREQPAQDHNRDDRDGTGERDANGPWTLAEWPHHRISRPCAVIAMAAGIHACENAFVAGIG